MLARLFSRVECVVVVAPPIAEAAETQILSAAADDVLLIIDTAASRLRDAAESIRLLKGVHAKLFGAVLIKIKAATGIAMIGSWRWPTHTAPYNDDE